VAGTKVKKTDLRKKIQECGGVISDVADAYRVHRQTVYRWLERFNLWDEVNNARVSVGLVADDIIYQRLMNPDEDKAWDAAKFVKLHLSDRGDSVPLSPRIAALLLREGISINALMENLEMLIEAGVATRMH
jgi:hypothetical protein